MTTDEKTTNFTTSCETCVFAQWKDGVQLDTCDLGRIEKYSKMGKLSSHEDGYHIINTICNACRGSTWANYNLGKDLITKVQEEIQVKVAFILMSIDDTKKRITNQLPELIQKCVSQKQVKPEQIIVVIKNIEIEYNEIFELLKECCEDIKFKLVRVIDYNADIYKCLDMGVQKCSSRYYAVFDLCNNIPINFIQTINHIINDELKPISMIKPIHQVSGMVIPTLLHRIFGGNKEMPIYEKIEEASRIQEKENHIYTWEQLWTIPK